MISIKLYASLMVIIVIICVDSASEADWDSNDNMKRMTETEASKFLESFKRLFGGKDEEIREDNNELGERRSEAFEAYEEKCEPFMHMGKRACPSIKDCGKGFEANVFNNYNPVKPAKKP